MRPGVGQLIGILVILAVIVAIIAVIVAIIAGVVWAISASRRRAAEREEQMELIRRLADREDRPHQG